MKQQIMFDLDDTLIHCNKYFYMVIDQFIDAMTTWFGGFSLVTEQAIRDKQMEIDIAGVAVFGFKSEHFPQSFVDTYIHFSHLTGRKRSVSEKNFLWKLGLSVYEHDTEPYPNMEQTLFALAEAGHELHLYTGGEMPIQRRKIEKLQLERYFDTRIYIRRMKNNDSLEDILSNGLFNRELTWMIGNSIRTDVVPALTAGIHAIHMRAPSEWEFNVIQINVEPKGAFLTLDHLKDVPDAIHQYVNR
ncbi:HAD hydrolase-like protein [Paenibacillus alkaliterrae]|uniref:HAD family hydrolase n=1 Tax=Paenibacillus alkaliterrae TaxID=320909 RepID=UPI001F15B5FC|nr:HAD hydrolase-like protein [Paenibacillus alkaliterrae]MCF2938261.1 HAD hydrolase-like protein [Paenibacillus alkaliterrae]